jgi:hypothetical protein
VKRATWVGLIVAGTTAVLGLGALASAPAPARADDKPGMIKVDVDNQMIATVQFCIKSDTSMKKPRGSDRACSQHLKVSDTETLYVEGGPNDHVWLDFEVFGEHTHDNFKEITGSHQCTATGVTIGFKMNCPGVVVPGHSFSEKPLSAFAFDSGKADDPGMGLLNLLAWAVTASAVAGLIITGANLGLQLRRGEPGEFSEHWRSIVLIVVSCVVGATAGPIMEFLHPWN